MRRLLLAAAGGTGAFTAPEPPPEPDAAYPDDWGITRYAGNPIIDVVDNPSETHEQYTPAPIKIGSEFWVYVKGSFVIYAWMATDPEGPYVLQNGGDPVIDLGSSGAWDDAAAIEPVAVYDEANGTIHLWYKGTGAVNPSGPSEWSFGHATASDSDPTTFTKDPANPLMTDTEVSASIGYNVYDMAIGDVIKIGSDYHFYGYVLQGASTVDLAVYSLWQATGSDWNDLDGSTVIDIFAVSPTTSVHIAAPCVFRMPGGGTPVYVLMYQYGSLSSTPRSIRAIQSPDGETWSALDSTDILSVIDNTWEGDWVYGESVLKVSVDPFALPYIDSEGRWLLYYSGQSDLGPPQPAGHHDNTGLAYLEPT